jgi:flagellar protein FlbD
MLNSSPEHVREKSKSTIKRPAYSFQGKQGIVIRVTRLNGSRFYVNAELVQTIEGTPDTVIALTNGTKIIVKEAPEVVVAEIVEYKRKIQEVNFKMHTGD